MTIQTNPRPEEILPLMHPVSLLQESITQYWPTYVLLAVFVVATFFRKPRTRDLPCDSEPNQDWLLPVVCCWGFQAVVSWLFGSTYGPLAYFAIDVLVALATLILIIVIVAITWTVATRLGVVRVAPLGGLAMAGIVITNALLIVSSLLIFYTKFQ